MRFGLRNRSTSFELQPPSSLHVNTLEKYIYISISSHQDKLETFQKQLHLAYRLEDLGNKTAGTTVSATAFQTIVRAGFSENGQRWFVKITLVKVFHLYMIFRVKNLVLAIVFVFVSVTIHLFIICIHYFAYLKQIGESQCYHFISQKDR